MNNSIRSSQWAMTRMVFLIFALFPAAIVAQESDKGKFSFSVYIQGQYQYGQKDASLQVGDDNMDAEKSFNRIGLRRGRIKLGYSDRIGFGAVQFDVTERGVGFKDVYLGLIDPWTRRNKLTAGLFSLPFGYEVAYSDSKMESTERSYLYRLLFPDARDLGAMLSLSPIESGAMSYPTLDVGVIAGNALNREIDNRRDIVGRLHASRQYDNGFMWGIGASYYYGHIVNPTAMEYEMANGAFVRRDLQKTGTFMKREYFGFDARVSFSSSLGQTLIRGEYVMGTQPGTAYSSESPAYDSYPHDSFVYTLFKRQFSGYYFLLSHKIKNTPLSAIIRYDMFDPNKDIEDDLIGVHDYTGEADLKKNVLGLGFMYDMNKHIRFHAYYEFVNNESAPNLYERSYEDKANMFTVRMQYKW